MKAIKLSEDHYVIVDESEIKEGDFYFDFVTNQIQRKLSDLKCKVKLDRLKITHSTQLLEGVKHIPLVEVEEAIYGYSVEKMAEEFGGNGKYLTDKKYGFRKGFNAHKELVKGKFILDEEQIRMIYDEGIKSVRFNSCLDGTEKTVEQVIQLLLPPTEWEVEFDEQGKLKLV